MEGLKWGFETKKFGKPNLNSKNRIFEMFSVHKLFAAPQIN